MKKPNHPTTLLTINADNAKGLLSRVLNILERPNYRIDSLNMAKTDIGEQLLITIEAHIPEQELSNLLRRLEKIIEVIQVSAQSALNADFLKVALFEIDPDKVDCQFWQLIQKYGAGITESNGYLLVQKIAPANDLLDLYNKLDRDYLVKYSESVLMV